MNDSWVNRTMYPFQSRYHDVGPGRMHYVDEGEGPVLVMVHGTPTWSFLYRHLIRELSSEHRVIAADQLGFGLSDRPIGWSYRPAEHAQNLAVLIERLGLRDVTLVVHDFGGPIGLAYALDHPNNVRALVLFNTWMWSLRGTSAEKMSRILGGGFGRFLYERLNFSPRVLVKVAFGDKRKLTAEIHRHYIGAFPTAAERRGPWVLARELGGSTDWYEELWRRRNVLATKPALLLWGMKDPAFGPDALTRWKDALPAARAVEFADAGHFVQEEAPEQAAREIRDFITRVDKGADAAGAIG
jgi:haloalkane dehalogenase